MRVPPILICTAFLSGLIFAVSVPVKSQEQTVASAANTALTPEQAQQTPAGKFIQDLGNKAISIITDKSLTREQRSGKYGDLLRDAFDLPAIGHFVLGRAWNAATPDQQHEYLNLFEGLVIRLYGDRLNFYSGESFHVKAVRPESDNDVVVNSEIAHPQGARPTSVDWRVRRANDKLAIVDVIIEGVSQSVTQRQEYASILERNNGNIDALLKLMREQVHKPEAVSP